MARVWIYQANRFLDTDAVDKIQSKIDRFIAGWNAHGTSLSAKGYVSDKLFIILEVDEEAAAATGCSIDKSVYFVKSLGEEFDIDFFDRYQVAYIDEQGNLKNAGRSDFEKLVKSGAVTEDTYVFDNTVTDSDKLAEKWKIPFKESWHSRVFV